MYILVIINCCNSKTEGRREIYSLMPSSPAAEKWGKITHKKKRSRGQVYAGMILGERPIAVSQAVTLVRPPHTKRQWRYGQKRAFGIALFLTHEAIRRGPPGGDTTPPPGGWGGRGGTPPSPPGGPPGGARGGPKGGQKSTLFLLRDHLMVTFFRYFRPQNTPFWGYIVYIATAFLCTGVCVCVCVRKKLQKEKEKV